MLFVCLSSGTFSYPNPIVMSPKRGSRKRKAAEENDTDEPNAGQSVEEHFNKGAKKRRSCKLEVRNTLELMSPYQVGEKCLVVLH